MTTSTETVWIRLALGSQLGMLIYFTIDNHVNLYPWNYLRSPAAELPSTLAAWIPFSLIMLAFAFRLRWGMLIGTVYAYVWLLLQIRQWWIPYLFGRTRLHRDFTWYHEHGYAETLKVLPPIGERPVPDLQHTALQLLSLLVVVTATVACCKVWKAPAEFAHRDTVGNEGYATDLDHGANPMTTERAILAGGCFWGMQDLIRRHLGVVSTRVGYAGGSVRNATYRNHGTHAEAIEIVFDPAKVSYRQILEFFFHIHDPSTPNRQGNDIGTSYRSAIFYTSDEQKRIAEDTIADVDASGLWPGKAVTEVVPAGDFWEAEPEHQDYLVLNPGGYTCHFIRPHWTLPVRKKDIA